MTPITGEMELESSLRDALADYDSAMTLLGTCGDGNCVIKKPIGMHTNGGCRCYTDETRARRAMQCASYLRFRLNALLSPARSIGASDATD